MDDDCLELATRLFAVMTATLKGAAGAAVAGQSSHAAAREIAVLAESATIVARPDAERRLSRPNFRP